MHDEKREEEMGVYICEQTSAVLNVWLFVFGMGLGFGSG